MRTVLAATLLPCLGLLACGGRSDSAAPVAPQLLETVAAVCDETTAATATLTSGASLAAPPGTASGQGELVLQRAALPDLPARAHLFGDLLIPGTRGDVRIEGSTKLTIPIPAGAPADVRAYEFAAGRYLLRREAVLDAAARTLTIDDPEINVLDVSAQSPRFRRTDRQAQGSPSPAQVTPTGIVLGSPAAAPATTPTATGTGVAGEIYEEPGKCFRVIFEVPAPRSLAVQVTQTLQLALDLYKREYGVTKGNLARVTPTNRMKVYLGDYGGDNGEYVPWSDTGWMKVSVTPALRSAAGLDETLYHEMFHGVQASFFNMVAAGNRGYWWFEASAEWAGLKARGMSLADMVRHDVKDRYKYALSVPIVDSADSQYEGGKLLSYAYCALIEHVESQKPGYVRRVLQSPSRSSGSDELRDGLVSEGNLTRTYASFVEQAVVPGYPDLWATGSLTVADQKCRGKVRPTDRLGDTDWTQEQTVFADYHFTDKRRGMGPMTLRLYTVTQLGVSAPCSVRVQLTETAGPSGARVSDHALLFTLPRGATALDPKAIRVGTGGTTVSGLGRTHDAIWIAVFNDDAQQAVDYEISVEVNRRTGPTQLASRADGDRTQVEFHSDALATLVDGGRLKFRLYRATSEGGPWSLASETEVSRSGPNITRTNGQSTGRDSFELDDRRPGGGDNQRAQELRPSLYKVCQVVPVPGGKDIEIASDVLAPSRPGITLVIDKSRGEAKLEGHGCKRKEWPDVQDSHFNGLFPLSTALELADQSFAYPAAHFVATWNGHERHFWAGRTEGRPAFTWGDARGEALAWLPSVLGSATLGIRGEGADGARATRELVVVYEPGWAAARKAAAAVPIDDDPAVRYVLASGEAAAANVKRLEAELAKETLPEQRRHIRRTILQEEFVALTLEEKRLAALLDRARRSRDACDFQGALDRVKSYLAAQPSYGERYLAWHDRDDALESEEDADAGRHARRISYKENMARWVLRSRLEALELAVRYADPAGDYATLSTCALTLIAEHAKLSPALVRDAGSYTYADLEWVREQLAHGTATLTGDRELAARYGLAAGMEHKHEAWWPLGAPSLTPMEEKAGELEKRQQEWQRAAEEVRRQAGIRIRPEGK